MHFTLTQSFAAISTGAAAWLMLQAGTAKGLLRLEVVRCTSCGRQRPRGRRCSCA